MTPENEKKYRLFWEKLRKSVIYFTNTFEDAAVKSIPAIKDVPGEGFWVKFKGEKEFKAKDGSKLVAEAIREYNEITEADYENW